MWTLWIIRILIVLVVVRMTWWFGSVVVKWFLAQPDVSNRGGVLLVRDPICGKFVDQSVAMTARDGGTVHYFCSEKCRREYDFEM